MSREKALARRSQLFVPANKPRFMATALQRGADAIILDLEDSVPVDELDTARRALAEVIPSIAGALDLFVRVNKPFRQLIEDLDAAVPAHPTGLVLPKVDSADEIRVMDALVLERELRHGIAPGSIEFQVLVETCQGLANVSNIAVASPRIVSLSLGVEDLAKELEIDPEAPAFDVSWAHGRVLMAAVAAGLAPYGLMRSLANFSDLEALADDVHRARQFGFVGAACIHPRQVAVLNEGFAPSDEEVIHAREVVTALEEAQRQGTAAISLHGRMIDVPVAERARRVLRRADLLSAQDRPS